LRISAPWIQAIEGRENYKRLAFDMAIVSSMFSVPLCDLSVFVVKIAKEHLTTEAPRIH
jgi:hypothetical protein